MKNHLCFILVLSVLCAYVLVSCTPHNVGNDENISITVSDTEKINEDTSSEASASVSEESTTEETSDTEAHPVVSDIPEGLAENVNTLTVECLEGTDNCWKFEDNLLTFSCLDKDTVCSLGGDFDGQIYIDCGDDFKLELELCGVTLYSSVFNPIEIVSGDKVTVSAKKGSENYIYDTREEVSSDDEHSAAIYSECDLDIEGKGKLTVISSNNNGIHTKDDLSVKNLTLEVSCIDNSLKGNDGVKISGGEITLISKTGDGIKTTNTDISKKGNQRGIVSVSGGTVNIYAACDGIDASYDVVISEEAVLNIYTDRYSPYSEKAENTKEDGTRYIRFTSKNYGYSVKYYNSESDYVWVDASLDKTVNAGRSTYYYYAFEKRNGYSSFQIFVYSSGQTQGQDEKYAVKTDFLTWNDSYDTFALESRNGRISYNWTNYSAGGERGWGGPGGPGGPGGMNDGNTEKGDHSAKGIKAGNEINISGGNIFIESYDDSLHANSEEVLENGDTPTGNVTISGGNLTLFSKDDGIHADGTLTVNDGIIDITGCYEGLEGINVVINGGEVSVVSSDDGINSTATSGVGITFGGGKVSIYAGGDGIDSNSRTSYQGIVFNGGDITVVSTSSMNSSIDTEQGYTYNGGSVLAICPSNGMGSESTKCKNFGSVGTKTTKSLKKGQTVTVKVDGVIASYVKMECQLSSLVIYLGSPHAEFSVIDEGSGTSNV